MTLATIDIGTNTTLLLVATASGSTVTVLEERAEITRLGRGVDASGRLDPAAIRETVAVLAAYAREARALGASRILCVATSAARDAANGAEFFEAARAAAGLAPEVISGEEEARLVYRSAWRDFGARGSPLVVLDVGGGSTELTYLDKGTSAWAISLPIGTVRLLEMYLRGAKVDAVAYAGGRSFPLLDERTDDEEKKARHDEPNRSHCLLARAGPAARRGLRHDRTWHRKAGHHTRIHL